LVAARVKLLAVDTKANIRAREGITKLALRVDKCPWPDVFQKGVLGLSIRVTPVKFVSVILTS
jgi:hypothetical protein